MRHKTAALAVLAAGMLAAPSTRAEGDHDLVARIAADGRLKTLASVLQRAGLVEALQGQGPFTVLAPTNEAFARVPKDVLGPLLREDGKAALQGVLGYHVVPGRLTSSDLLPTARASTLQGATLPLGLTVGEARVVQADLLCSNGVIHVIDRVLLPPASPPASADGLVRSTIEAAIDRGVPIFNRGDHEGCRVVYETAAHKMLAMTRGHLGEMHRLLLEDAQRASGSASDRAWALRRAFDEILADLAFEPKMEAPLPEGFPEPGPVGHVVVKRYPAYRGARAEGQRSFWQLFNHIKKNDIQMTAPVEMTMDEGMAMQDMAFLYERPSQGDAGMEGRVEVLDFEPATVLSLGVRGATSAESVARAKRLLEARMRDEGWQPAGSMRMMGYNSPFVAQDRRYWELQVPVRPAGD